MGREYGAMNESRKATISDIARESGFSESTVSLVINNSPKISSDTRAKVLQTIERHGYRPNMQARGLATRSARTLSVVVPDLPRVFADPYFGEVMSGIYAHAVEAGYKILPDIATPKFVRTREYLSLLETRQADGMLFVGASDYDRYLRDFQDSPHPFLMVNNYFARSPVHYVCVDHREAARLAAGHLLELGHRVVGQIHGMNVQAAEDFRDAFERAMADAGVPLEDMPWSDGRYTEAMGYEAARTVLAMNPRITALVCGSSRMAEGALRFLSESGRRVPEDVSVLGNEEFALPLAIADRLTAVRHPVFEVGELACKNLIALARREIRQCQMSLAPTLAIRKTTAPPRK